MKKQNEPGKPPQTEAVENARNLIQIRLSPKADGNLQKLVLTTGITNRTQLVNAAIELATDVITTIQKGGSVVYELPDGSKERLRVVGV
jgi:hypothetical protein